MVPFIETITSKMDLVAASKNGFDDFTSGKISKNDFLIYFGFTHAEAIIKFYGEKAKDQEKLLVEGGFETGSSAYFSAGINAWKNLKAGKYIFPPIKNEDEGITNNVNLPDQPLQQIFYGAPGTGKSHQIDGQTNENNSIRTTFHPDTDYATFVGAYKPMMDTIDEYALDATGKTHKVDYPNGKSSIIYKYEPQVFLKAYIEAWKRYLTKQDGEDDNYYLVIEEINRGNCAQIFGDLFQLLDREDSGYSSYAISPESSITKYLAEESQSADGTKFSDLEFSDVTKYRDGVEKIIATADDLKAGKRLVLPPNLHIWATMNTSDQSLFPIDSAFKRRWEWKYTRIAQGKKEDGTLEHWKLENDTDWWDFLKKINAIIDDMTQSADKQLGYYFCKPDKENDTISYARFVNKVLFYLWNDIFKTFSTDEYEQLFKIKRLKTDADGKWIEPHELEDKEVKLTFPEFYDEKGDVIPEIAKQFIEKVIAWGGKPAAENA